MKYNIVHRTQVKTKLSAKHKKPAIISCGDMIGKIADSDGNANITVKRGRKSIKAKVSNFAQYVDPNTFYYSFELIIPKRKKETADISMNVACSGFNKPFSDTFDTAVCRDDGILYLPDLDSAFKGTNKKNEECTLRE